LGVLGSKEYREQRLDEVKDADILTLRQALQDRPEIKEVLNLVSKITGVKLLDLTKPSKKSTVNSAKRAFAIYACKTYSGATYKAIAEYFNLTHVGSVCYPLAKIKKEIAAGGWMKEVEKIEKVYFIVKYT